MYRWIDYRFTISSNHTRDFKGDNYTDSYFRSAFTCQRYDHEFTWVNILGIETI